MQVVASLLIVCVILVLSTIAYNWGMPLIERSESSARLDYAKAVIFKIADNIESVSSVPEDQKSISGRITDGTMEIGHDDSGSGQYVLLYHLDSSIQFFTRDQWMPLNDANYYLNKTAYGAPNVWGIGVYGINRGAVVWGRSFRTGSKYRNTLKVNGSILFANETDYDFVKYNTTCDKPISKTNGPFDLTVKNYGMSTVTNAGAGSANLTILIGINMK